MSDSKIITPVRANPNLCHTCTAGFPMKIGVLVQTPEGGAAIQPMNVVTCSDGYIGPRDCTSIVVLECDEYEEKDPEADQEKEPEANAPDLAAIPDDRDHFEIPVDEPVDPTDLTDEQIDSIRKHVLDQTKNDPNFVPAGATPRSEAAANEHLDDSIAASTARDVSPLKANG